MLGRMKIWLLLLPLLLPLLARAEADTINLPDLLQGAQEWAAENLDTNLLNALPELDQAKADQFLRDLQKQFQGDYVINLAALREPANVALPLLESQEATQPYAAWLRSRLDYLKVADEFLLTIPAPKVTPEAPAKPPPNPSAAREREVWVKEVAHRPWPAGASNQVPQLKLIFLREKVPPELVWVAEVESSLDARARSPVGAAGLFQLMPATAKRFGLSLWPQDERLQPDASARASAQYLKFLHGRFRDWRLALAAYNSGEGTVDRLLKRHNTRSYDDIAGNLPAETQMFVPKVEAVLLRREGVRLADLSTP
jgi:membrane-bound lytic murein transglycosylase D